MLMAIVLEGEIAPVARRSCLIAVGGYPGRHPIHANDCSSPRGRCARHRAFSVTCVRRVLGFRATYQPPPDPETSKPRLAKVAADTCQHQGAYRRSGSNVARRGKSIVLIGA